LKNKDFLGNPISDIFGKTYKKQIDQILSPKPPSGLLLNPIVK
jgi:hypothetical protein